jgi:hypothetical protein
MLAWYNRRIRTFASLTVGGSGLHRRKRVASPRQSGGEPPPF